jgi:uncharacterized membrane protein YgcG
VFARVGSCPTLQLALIVLATILKVTFAVCGAHLTPSFVLNNADSRVVFTELFDEVCQQFNISVPATESRASSSETRVKAEYWNNDNGGSGSYGGSGSSSGGYGGGGGSWQRGAASSVAANALLVWLSGSVVCALALKTVF